MHFLLHHSTLRPRYSFSIGHICVHMHIFSIVIAISSQSAARIFLFAPSDPKHPEPPSIVPAYIVS
eukprot:c7282_g1_i1 orf=90-287(-)